MHFALLLPALGLFAAAAPDYNFGIAADSIAPRQDPASRIVVGRLPYSSNGSVPLRPELRAMRADKYRWDLFVLALSMFQSASQDDPLSWYQVAGIHGVPFATWNGVEPVSGASQSGYCTHGSVLFPMWHRPYLALYEQQLYRLANSIARMFSNSTERMLYQQVASDFRVPYWDWASPAPPGESFFPSMLMEPVLSQYGPNGVQTIRNPLYSYSFHPLDEQAFIWDPLKQWNETKRAPDMTVSIASPPSMNDQVDKALLSKLPEIQQRLYALFSSYHDFNSFGNKGWAASQNLSTLDSIEAVHDIIHIYGGSRGHMTYVPLSSFDPLFFLHHTMVDRLIAMWQLLNPTAWIVPMAAGETSYTSLAGTMQNSSTPLTPFLVTSDGQFWNSDMSRSTEAFGYAYADTRVPLGMSGRRTKESLIRKINKWLGGSSVVGLRLKSMWQSPSWQPHGAGHHVGDGTHTLLEGPGFRPYIKIDAQDPPTSHIINEGYYTEWLANVHVNSDASETSFAVHFFIGEPPEDAKEWISAPNLAGSVGFFSMSMMADRGSKMSGSVPLTSALTKLVGARVLANIEPETVLPFLKKALRFRIEGAGESEASPETLSGLYVSVSSSQVRVPYHDAELPKWGETVERYQLWG